MHYYILKGLTFKKRLIIPNVGKDVEQLELM